jgi:SAM-dependent methyltransferase
MTLCINPDILIRPITGGGWVASNPRVHSHVELEPRTIYELTKYSAQTAKSMNEEGWIKLLGASVGYDRTVFAQSKGLMVDATGYGDRGEALTGQNLLATLLKGWILMDEGGAAYGEFCSLKTSPLDEKHLGSLHQAVGHYQFFELRTNEPWRWWHDQKFTPDGLQIRPGMYKWIQEHFFHEFFSSVGLKGKRVIDYACGNGFYSSFFARSGAVVTGIDTSVQLIDLARKNFGELAQFVCPGNAEGCMAHLSTLEKASIDVIYLSDALLFFFSDLRTHEKHSGLLDRLLREFARLLRPDGTFYLMEPNASFWLASRFGTKERPFAVVPEFRRKVFQVAPTSSEIISAVGEAGLAVTKLIHPRVSSEATQLDPSAHAYASEFPLWDFYEIRKHSA